MINQSDLITSAYLFLVVAGIITSAGAIFVYLLSKSKSKKRGSK